MRRWAEGSNVSPPVWATCLEMSNGDPLRAKNIFDEIDMEWWHRWIEYRNAKVKAEEKNSKSKPKKPKRK